MSESMFPIMLPSGRWPEASYAIRKEAFPFAVVGVPWALIAKHEAQARTNHGQTLGELAGRGGLSAAEAVAVLEGRPFRAMREGDAHVRLAALIIGPAFQAAFEAGSTP